MANNSLCNVTVACTDEPVNVFCFGDSNTFGYRPSAAPPARYPYRARWTTMLQQELGIGHNVVVEGLMGRTTDFDHPFYGEWERGTYYLGASLVSHYPIDIAVVMLGTNDCMAELGKSAREVAEGMEAVLDEIDETLIEFQGFAPQLILVCPAAIREDWEGSLSDVRLTDPEHQEIDTDAVIKSRELAPLYRQISEKRGCHFVDASGFQVSPVDCIHLSELGHRQLAEAVTRQVRSIAIPQANADVKRAILHGSGRE